MGRGHGKEFEFYFLIGKHWRGLSREMTSFYLCFKKIPVANGDGGVEWRLEWQE